MMTKIYVDEATNLFCIFKKNLKVHLCKIQAPFFLPRGYFMVISLNVVSAVVTKICENKRCSF